MLTVYKIILYSHNLHHSQFVEPVCKRFDKLYIKCNDAEISASLIPNIFFDVMVILFLHTVHHKRIKIFFSRYNWQSSYFIANLLILRHIICNFLTLEKQLIKGDIVY